MENRDVQILECAMVRETHFSGQGVVTRDCRVAFKQLMDLVALMIDLLGKRFLPRGSLAF